MSRIEVHQNIRRIIELLQRVGCWQRQEEETVGERKLKLFYSIYYSLFLMSMVAGVFASDNRHEQILSVEASMIAGVFVIKLWCMTWRGKKILVLLNRTCEYSIDDWDSFILIKAKLNIFMKFAYIFLVTSCCFCLISEAVVVPLVCADCRNSEFAYWTAFTFLATQMIMTAIPLTFSVIIWYLLASSAWRFDILGQRMRKLGEMPLDETEDERRFSNAERDNSYCRDLVGAIESHTHLKELTDELDAFLSKIFTVQLTTSAVCICGSVYSIVFIRGDTVMDTCIYLFGLLYNIFDIFMVMHFGNEIKLASDRLSYSLFESDWINRAQSIKRNVAIFGQFIMHPHQLTILKIYPLTLQTFTSILESAYSLFNIIKNFK